MNCIFTILAFCSIITIGQQRSFSDDTQFVFNTTVSCHLRGQRWCVQLTFVEHDEGETTDVIHSTDTHCTDGHKQIIETFGQLHGDGPNDDLFELAVMVKHNCRTDERFVIYDHLLPSVSTEITTHEMDIKLQL